MHACLQDACAQVPKDDYNARIQEVEGRIPVRAAYNVSAAELVGKDGSIPDINSDPSAVGPQEPASPPFAAPDQPLAPPNEVPEGDLVTPGDVAFEPSTTARSSHAFLSAAAACIAVLVLVSVLD